jgi:hypothetical protein
MYFTYLHFYKGTGTLLFFFNSSASQLIGAFNIQNWWTKKTVQINRSKRYSPTTQRRRRPPLSSPFITVFTALGVSPPSACSLQPFVAGMSWHSSSSVTPWAHAMHEAVIAWQHIRPFHPAGLGAAVHMCMSNTTPQHTWSRRFEMAHRKIPQHTRHRCVNGASKTYVINKQIEMSEQTKSSTVPTVPTIPTVNNTTVPVVVRTNAFPVLSTAALPPTSHKSLPAPTHSYTKMYSGSCQNEETPTHSESNTMLVVQPTRLPQTRTVVVNIRPRRRSVRNRRRPCWRTSCKKSLVMLMCKAHGRDNRRSLYWQHALEVYTWKKEQVPNKYRTSTEQVQMVQSDR